MKTIISMEHVEKCFQNEKALSDTQLNVEKGEIFGLLGPSGAGKTTIIKILTGQLGSSKGSLNNS